MRQIRFSALMRGVHLAKTGASGVEMMDIVRAHRRGARRPEKRTRPALMLANTRPPQEWFCILQIGGLL